jgi:hypothetical protein
MKREDTGWQPTWCLPFRVARPVSRSVEARQARPRPLAPPLADGTRTTWVCIGLPPADEFERVLG